MIKTLSIICLSAVLGFYISQPKAQSELQAENNPAFQYSLSNPQYLIGALILFGSLYFFYLILSGSLPALTQ
jgi:hypothetical protein